MIFKERKPFSGQDPFVVPFEDEYLLIQSAYGNRRLVIKQFRNLEEMNSGISTTVWIEDHLRQLWAPELHQIDSSWYIFYTASQDGLNENHRLYVLEANHPLGPYRSLGRVITPNNQWAIDQTVFQHNSQWYALWSGWDAESPGFPQHLYGALMEAPNRIGERSLLASPDLNWEQTVAPIIEGPQVLRQWKVDLPLTPLMESKLYISYSADASWTNEYKMGLLEYNGGPILSKSSWNKSPKPILTGGGHGCFVEKYFIYHRKLSADPGWADREIVVLPYTFDANGYPRIGEEELSGANDENF